MSFGQVGTLLLLGFDHFHIVLIFRVPADKNICFAIKFVDGIKVILSERNQISRNCLLSFLIFLNRSVIQYGLPLVRLARIQNLSVLT